MSASADLELLTVGRVSVDLYPQQDGPMRHVQTLSKSIGGTATNVAVATARLGHRVALITKVGDDAFGDDIRHALSSRFAVDSTWVSTHPSLPTPLAFAELDPRPEPSIIFYRYPSAPDEHLDFATDFAGAPVTEVPIFWLPASRFAFEASRAAVGEALERRGRRAHTVLDLDWRPHFWADEATATAAIEPMLDRVTIAIGNREECRIAVGTDEPDEAADRLLARGLDAAVIKLGADGVMVAVDDGTRETVAPFPVEVVCGLGAGDAFGGAFCHGLLEGWDLPRCVRYGNAAGAIVAGRLLCADDMPTVDEIETFLADRADA